MADEKNPVVLIHGYSDKGESFKAWRNLLAAQGYKVSEISICNYQSLTNEVTIKDIAEGFDRALRTHAHLKEDRPFDAIVHSTGMLVIRSWLTTYASRRGRLKRLIALAPATFGSPLAHKGRGFLGSIFKANRAFGPDFLEAGDLVLDGLELGSRFTWDLTHEDLLCKKPFYGHGNDTPYVFVFCGTEGYPGIRQLANEAGTDGTVRWAGCALNTQKIVIDLTREPGISKATEDADAKSAAEQSKQPREPQAAGDPKSRFESSDLAARETLPIPFWPIEGKNHGSILGDPGDTLAGLVYEALQVDSEETFKSWTAQAMAITARVFDGLTKWQQFVVRAVDERNDPIPDFHVELFTKRDGSDDEAVDFDLDVHAYGADKSLRCFHVNLTKLKEILTAEKLENLWVRVIASSGSALVGYHGVQSEKLKPDLSEMDKDGVWDAQIKLPTTFEGTGVTLFHPFTTTFVELKLNRDPMPFGQVANKICDFLRD